MRSSSQKVENNRIQLASRFATRSPREAVLQSALRAVHRLTPERWLIEALVLALAGLLIGAAALSGIAMVSAWAPTAHPLVMRGDRETGADAFRAWGDSWCHETQ